MNPLISDGGDGRAFERQRAGPIPIRRGAAAERWIAERSDVAFEPEVRARVRAIIGRVQRDGDAALSEFTERFDGVRPASLRVPRERCERALEALSSHRRDSLERAKRNLEAFHAAQRRRERPVEVERGVLAWREFRPIERVGVYVPGGRAPYPSSLLMAAVPARLAGCDAVIVCSPPGAAGEPAEAILAAAALAGVDELYAVGGAQAIAALAFGTESIHRVDKIFGPGSRWVNEAKLEVFRHVAVDLPAGPSEVLVWADGSAPPGWIAAELLAQAEHGPDSLCVAVVEDDRQAVSVSVSLAKQLVELEPSGSPAHAASDVEDGAYSPGDGGKPGLAGPARASLARSALLVASGADEAREWVNALAAEHLVVMRRDAADQLPRVRHAGSVFLGSHAPVAAGDYASGTNHVLPTSRRARGAGGLALDDFGRWIQVQAIDRAGLKRIAPAVVALAEWEGFAAHAASIRVRLEGELAARGGSVCRPGRGSTKTRAHAAAERLEATRRPPSPAASRAHSTTAAVAVPSRATPSIEALVRPHVREVRPYEAARSEHQSGILLDANENALGTLVPELDPELHRYPDPANRELKIALGRQLGVPADRLWLGNGSDEVIDVLIRTLLDPGETVVVASPTYGVYGIRAATHGAFVREAPLDATFDVDVARVAALAADAKLIFLCSPNNPTGGLLSVDRVLRLVKRCGALVTVDEAYIEFAEGPSLVSQAGTVERLAVMRTFSKAWGLAGARVGYLVGAPALVRHLDTAGLPYPLSRPAARAALRALGRAEEMRKRRRRVVAERERVRKRLEGLGLRVLPSEANFLLFFVPDPGAMQAELARRFGVVVRDRSRLPGLAGALRVTIGKEAENQTFLAALEMLLGAGPTAGETSR